MSETCPKCEEASAAVQKLFDCFDDGLLIRDCSKDHEDGHYITTGLRITAALAGCQRVIDNGIKQEATP